MKLFVLFFFIFYFSCNCISQVNAKKNINGYFLKQKNNLFKSILFQRDIFKPILIVTYESYKNIQITIKFKVLKSNNINYKGQKCTKVVVLDKNYIKTSFVFVNNRKKVYMVGDNGYEISFTGSGVYYD